MLLTKLITGWEFKETPKMYGTFHLICFAIMIILCVTFAIIGKKNHQIDKKIDLTVFLFGAFFILIEIYKQVFYTIEAGHYQWYAFPFQFCSVPMYVAFISPLIKNRKVKDYAYRFLIYFGLLAGLLVMLYPGDVFTKKITISIHSMLWHGGMVVLGTFLMFSKNFGHSYLDLLKSSVVYTMFVAIALVLNVVMYNLIFKETSDTFNMFFISPYYQSHIIILGDIQAKYGFFVHLICYIIAFNLGASVMFLINFALRKIEKLHSLKKNKVNNSPLTE